ncbi:MAG TPA: DMT family transporter [Dongiaceae bacterium]|jgi:drug/metabolite transporter (DMT)-like permease|nr:DMT family transporter [Dongiaceae bacterium]
MGSQINAASPLSAAHAASRNTAIGITLVLASAVAWSTSGFFARVVPVDIWLVLFWRSLFGALSIIVLAMIERKRFAFDWRRAFTPAGIAMMVLNATGMLSFIYSLQNTTIANVTVIYATLPFITAILAWLWFHEPAERRTVIGSLVAGAGVAITVGGTIAIGGGSHLLGDLAALYLTVSFAFMTVIMRRYREAPMLESVGMACLLMTVVALFFGDPFTLTVGQITWLAAFGIVTQGGGLGIYTMGARRLPSAQAALLSASEVPLSPLWVWIFFEEVPPTETFIGGGLVLAAILWNIGAELRSSRSAGTPLS